MIILKIMIEHGGKATRGNTIYIGGENKMMTMQKRRGFYTEGYRRAYLLDQDSLGSNKIKLE